MARYPFSPAILDSMPMELGMIYRALEDQMLDEICHRIQAAGELNEVTIQNMRSLRALGISQDEIEKAIESTLGLATAEVDSLFAEAIARNEAYYGQMISASALTAPESLVDGIWIRNIIIQTESQLANITRSMGFLVDHGQTMLPPARAYQWALDRAVLQIQGGSISYTQAIKNAVKELADSGLITMTDHNGNPLVVYEPKTVTGKGHRDHLDVAVRRATMTGIGQLNQKYTLNTMDTLGTSYVEVSAHGGARNTGSGPANHESWQGKIYFYNRTGRARNPYRLPDFVETTGYGTGAGLGGWNCRHTFYAYDPDVMEPSYSAAELDELKAENNVVKYQGHEYDGYQATQMQRTIERTIRKYTREKNAYEAAGLDKDAKEMGTKITQLKHEYREFSAAAELPTQADRYYVYRPQK